MSTKNLFEIAGVSKRYKVTKPIRLIELFAGIGAQAAALERLGANFEHYRVCEFDKYAIASYNAVHGTNFETSDIREIHASDLGIVETDKYEYLMTYSFPCVTEDSLILTEHGYKKIIDVNVGDYVLTKSNTWHKVAKKFDNGIHPTCYINSFGFSDMHVTLNHKFYVRSKYYKFPYDDSGKKKRLRLFTDPEFKEAKDLTRNDYFGIPVVSEEVEFYKNDLWFWYLIGFYVGDGWLNDGARDVVLSCNDSKLDKFKSHISENDLHYTLNDLDKSCHRIRFYDSKIYKFIETYIGTGCTNKRIPCEILKLPKPQLEMFLQGYIDTDGNINNVGKASYTRISSVNIGLLYMVSLIVAKLYNRPSSINKEAARKHKHYIDGREIKSNYPVYELKFKYETDKQDKAFYEDGYIWYPFYSLTMASDEHVYNMEVEDDHSYILNGCISKNCTDLSVAGKQAGMSRDSGTRSGLLWEVERLLKECGTDLPQILLMENVTQVHSEKFLPDFLDWINFLESLGYSNFYQDMNAKDYGVAQSRNRTFMISILGNYTYTFPHPIPLKKRMRDYLETHVDDKYYIRSEKAMQLIQKLIDSSDLSQPQSACDMTVNNPSIIDIANCITARYDCGVSTRVQSGTGVVETGIVQNLATPDPSVEAEFKSSDVAGCLAAREYKGFSNWGSNAVVTEKKPTDSCE